MTASASVLCASRRKNNRSTAAWGRVCAGKSVNAFCMSPALVMQHKEQHLADAAKTVSQRCEGEER